MSSQLLFECLSEDIPSRMHQTSISYIKQYLANAFQHNNLEYSSIEVFITARRMTLFISNIRYVRLDQLQYEIRGPKVHSPKKSIEGFLQKHRKHENCLFIKRRNNEDFYFIKIEKSSLNIKQFLKTQLESMLKDFSWSKSMRWDVHKERWIRPIQNIVCIFNNEIIPLSFAGIHASNTTYGHRFLAQNNIFTVNSPEEYFKLLQKFNVILQQDVRKKMILDQIEIFSQKNNVQLEKNDKLLNELVGLVEWPIVLFGTVNHKQLLGLPREVILSIINTQQRYLVLSDKQKISFFVTVVSIKNKKVIQGFERALQSRLSDAQFLISQDQQHPLTYYVKKSGSILFHASLGTIADKVERIISLSRYVAICLSNVSLIKINRAAYLSKADLSTLMVRQFSELQGVMGGYYAEYFQEDKEVIDAISEHYYPMGLEQDTPKSPCGIALSIADKMDSLVGLILAGEKISGSYDRFGLRRMTIGIIRIILENNLHIPMKNLIDQSLSLYSHIPLVKEQIQSNNTIDIKSQKNIAEQVFQYCLIRFRVMLQNKGIKKGVIYAIIHHIEVNDLLIAEQQITILHNFLARSDGIELLKVYKRIYNIIQQSKQHDNIHVIIPNDKKSCIEYQTSELENYSMDIYTNITNAIQNNQFHIAISCLMSFATFMNQFMNSIAVNCISQELRNNRFTFLKNALSIFHLIANFHLMIIHN
ncbi:glycine--tRNA ligase subunit beta [Wolbachia endosymbiont of Howardula sp.]|uniref:glycine--tRNA ligase subunit beta n=1 Tax=Wolbachia endosymbiont of Howardula sp. TaxID=2916816 RepID=UPI00217D88DF|nr:glycine--tRNA ligase subunit beta [Wolbachia endosymbiont of Howardula sp.]UWI83051.1 glycine--tRNA ligase subunit beta [Wolbachia endosymbiont of Howardula sp.]